MKKFPHEFRRIAGCSRFAVLILILCFVGNEMGQSQTMAVPERAAFAKEELELLSEINLARTQPQQYADFIDSYYKNQTTKEGAAALSELLRILKSSKPLSELQPVSGLRLAAKVLVDAQGATGETGRYAIAVEERISRYGVATGPVGENVSYGQLMPREQIMRALLDDGIPSRMHRLNVLRAEYRSVGISCGSHKEYDAMCVIILAGDFTPRS